MKKYLVILFGCIFLGITEVFAQNTEKKDINVVADVYSQNGRIGTSNMRFSIYQNRYTIVAYGDYGNLAQFSPETNSTISTGKGPSGYRWWLTGAYYGARNILEKYFIVIFDPSPNDNGVRVFFKTASADKSRISETKYIYVLSEKDWDNVFKNFIIPCTDKLKVVNQGDIFDDGININKEAIDKR